MGREKTTTIRMLCGLTHPTAGNATIAGVDVWKDRQDMRTKFGYVPQRFSLYRDLTVLENFRFSAAPMEFRVRNWSGGSSACFG